MEKIISFILAAVLVVALALVFAVPTAFLLMLFLGNIGVKIGFLGCIPGVMALRGLQFSVTKEKEK